MNEETKKRFNEWRDDIEAREPHKPRTSPLLTLIALAVLIRSMM